jgi:hypothetical protein
MGHRVSHGFALTIRRNDRMADFRGPMRPGRAAKNSILAGAGREIRVNSGEPAREVRMLFPEDDDTETTETCFVTPMGPKLYRMEQSSVLREVRYHDVVEAELQTDGIYRFLRVVTPSGLTTVSWVLSQALIESRAMADWLEKVEAVGGNWERVFGGLLIVHLPPAEHDAMMGEFNNLFNQRSPEP